MEPDNTLRHMPLEPAPIRSGLPSALQGRLARRFQFR